MSDEKDADVSGDTEAQRDNEKETPRMTRAKVRQLDQDDTHESHPGGENAADTAFTPQWIMLMPDTAMNGKAKDETAIVHLKHPRTEKKAMFMFVGNDVYEILAQTDDTASWFVDQTVQSDGRLFLPSPVDPLFLVLPYLISISETGKFHMLSQIVESAEYPENHRLATAPGVQDLELVAECKGQDDLKAYKYSTERTLSWLKKKVQRLASHLREQKVTTSTSGVSHSHNYVPSGGGGDSAPDEVYMRFAHGIVSDYLPVTLATELREHLGIKEIVHEKPKIDEPKSKRSKQDIAPTDDYSGFTAPVEKVVKLTASQKKLEQAKKGSKLMTSFFKKKT